MLEVIPMLSQENFLLHAIIPGESSDRDYNPDIAGPLGQALKLITAVPRRRNAFQLARKRILRYANYLMSRRQRARVLYILGGACSDEGFYPHASDYLDEALDHAVAVHGFAESAKLAHLLGTIQGQIYCYRRATYYHSVALNALDEGPYPPDPALAADIAIALASCHFALEHYHMTRYYGTVAARHISYLPPLSKQLAALKWMWAMCHRWRGEAYQGFALASTAATIYSAIGSSPAAQSRIEGIAADCACDLALSYSLAAYGRDHFLTYARDHATRSLRLTTGGTDFSGRVLALLRQIRLARLTGTSYDWRGTAESIIKDISATRDISLIAQAYTTLGDEFTAHDERESGLYCYRAALDMLRGSEVLHLSRWPRAAILMDSEMRVID
jgi:hypothetical protein